jgi:hypothetical protein
MKIILQWTLALILFLGYGTSTAWSQAVTYDYTGGVQTYTVPAGVFSIQIEAWGAQGGTGTYAGITPDPGLGGYAVGSLDVTPGEVLNIYVGGAGASTGLGGYNGGGQAGTDYGASGGGASDVRTSPYTLSDREIVGAGGGGAAFGSTPSDGGHGGALVGLAGDNGDSFVGGGGGTQVAGGAAGCCYGAAIAGTFGAGGGPGDYHNAGGGGGWYGGGSGAGQAGAGGGSSYITGLVDGSTTAGLRSGSGQIIITILCTPLTVTVSDETICFGESLTLDATSVSGATIIWSDGIENGVPFTPDGFGFITYTAVSSDGDDCAATIEILVLPPPNVIAHVDEALICEGMEIVLYGTGATSYEWDVVGVVDDEPFSPPLGLSTYIVTGTTGLGCVNSDTITLEVFPAPAVSGTVDDSSICLGESITLTGDGADVFEWTPAPIIDGEPFTPTEVGSYAFTVIGMNEFGCEGTDEVTVDVNEALVISYITTGEEIGGDGAIDITVTGGTPPYSFDWDNDGTGDFDDTEDLTGISGGDYTVVVNCSEGCYVNETITVNSQLGIDGDQGINISVYPNPTSNKVTIQLEGPFVYSLLDLNGHVLAQSNAFNTTTLDLCQFATGIYFVILQTTKGSQTVKLVKQ